jgi:hypothetical protein
MSEPDELVCLAKQSKRIRLAQPTRPLLSEWDCDGGRLHALSLGICE